MEMSRTIENEQHKVRNRYTVSYTEWLWSVFSNNWRCYETDNLKQDEKVVCVRHLSGNCMSTKYSRAFQQSCKYSNPSQPSVISIRMHILKVVPKQRSLFIIYYFKAFTRMLCPVILFLETLKNNYLIHLSRWVFRSTPLCMKPLTMKWQRASILTVRSSVIFLLFFTQKMRTKIWLLHIKRYTL